MRNLRRTVAILSGILGVTGGVSAVVVGCGGDDTIIGTGGPDSGGDVAADVAVDTGVLDAGSDAFYFDAGPPKLEEFYLQINKTGCALLQNCCTNGSEGYDGGFDLSTCAATFNPASGGFLYTSPVQDPIDGGGNVTFHEDEASQCLSLILGLSCTEQWTTAQMTAIRTACNSAVVGNIPAGSTGCRDTIECTSPAHCEIGTDGGGTCVAPYATGASCIVSGDTDLTSLARCGRPFTGLPGYCEVGDGLTLPEAGTCATPGANGTPCYSPFECQGWLCDVNGTGQCADSAQILTPGNDGLCSAFAPVDGG